MQLLFASSTPEYEAKSCSQSLSAEYWPMLADPARRGEVPLSNCDMFVLAEEGDLIPCDKKSDQADVLMD